MNRKRTITVMSALLFLINSASAQEEPSGDPPTSGEADSLSREERLALAEQLYRQGREQMDARRYVQACESFAASLRYDSGTGGTLWHLARCRERTGDFASAWARYSELQGFAQGLGERDKAQAALERAQAIESRIPRLTIRVSRSASNAGLRISHNGAELDAAAWGAGLPVDPGTHLVLATAPNHLDYRRRILIRRDSEGATIEIPPLTPEPTPPDTSNLPEEVTLDPGRLDPWYRYTIGWSLAGAALACFLTTPFLFEHGNALDTDADSERDFEAQEPVRLQARRYRAAGFGLLSGGFAFSIASALTFLFRPESEKPLEIDGGVGATGAHLSATFSWGRSTSLSSEESEHL
ncbi:MAG: hypothetical protein AAF550_07020 [Myxococcota bacterium]